MKTLISHLICTLLVGKKAKNLIERNDNEVKPLFLKVGQRRPLPCDNELIFPLLVH